MCSYPRQSSEAKAHFDRMEPDWVYRACLTLEIGGELQALKAEVIRRLKHPLNARNACSICLQDLSLNRARYLCPHLVYPLDGMDVLHQESIRSSRRYKEYHMDMLDTAIFTRPTEQVFTARDN